MIQRLMLLPLMQMSVIMMTVQDALKIGAVVHLPLWMLSTIGIT